MKKIYKPFVVFVLAWVGLSACEVDDSFLEKKTTGELDYESVFTDSVRTLAFLSTIYGGNTYDFAPKTATNTPGGIFSELTDESETRYPQSASFALQFNAGAYGPDFYKKIGQDWATLYQWIRATNIYISSVNMAPFSAELKSRTSAEARFLRAFYYHFLLKEFGGVPLVGDNVYDVNNIPVLPRNSFEECIEYLVKELDEMAPLLPLTYTGLEVGRVTRGAALGLKSRILLTAASPLHNGKNPVTDPAIIPLTGYTAYSEARWERAMKAAEDVINLEQYSLYVDNATSPGYGFYQVFQTRINNEFIFWRQNNLGKGHENMYLPASRGGAFQHHPQQYLVDAFPMDNGKPIAGPDKDTRYTDDDPYVNRDPRFYYTIIYNGSNWLDNVTNRQGPIYTYDGAPRDGLQQVTNNLGTKTGYYRRKLMDVNITRNRGTSARSFPLMRYAEILLNYAEAANEINLTSQAMEKLKLLRERAGIIPGADNNYGFPADPSQEVARELIRNERFIELAFEEHRFWDIRRWKVGDPLFNRPSTGMRVIRNGNNYTYERIPVVRERSFNQRQYFFPIPNAELTINPLLKQNPGW